MGGQEYDPAGPVDEMTESCRLTLLATLGVQTDELSLHITYLQPLQGDELAHHPLSSLSGAASTKPSSTTQNVQLANYLTLVVTVLGAD